MVRRVMCNVSIAAAALRVAEAAETASVWLGTELAPRSFELLGRAGGVIRRGR